MKAHAKAPRWRESFNLGLPDIDREHCGLFAALSDLSIAALNEDWPVARQLLRVIPVETTRHFRREERWMRRAGYSGSEWHRRQHSTAGRRVAALVEGALLAGIAGCEAVLEYFCWWLPKHIGVHDRMMSACVRNYRRSIRLGQGRPVVRQFMAWGGPGRSTD